MIRLKDFLKVCSKSQVQIWVPEMNKYFSSRNQFVLDNLLNREIENIMPDSNLVWFHDELYIEVTLKE